MSGRLFEDDIIFLQRLLKSAGLYEGTIDGLWGPLTNKSVDKFEQESDRIEEAYGRFDARTERNIKALQLEAQKAARQFMRKVRDAGIRTKIISGTRTYAEQNQLFRIGRYGNPGSIVTKARGGGSNHNFGIAWDIGIFAADGSYMTKGQLYDDAAKAGLSDELEWGGNWRSFVDKPHYQLKTDNSLKVVREKFEVGEPYFSRLA